MIHKIESGRLINLVSAIGIKNIDLVIFIQLKFSEILIVRKMFRAAIFFLMNCALKITRGQDARLKQELLSLALDWVKSLAWRKRIISIIEAIEGKEVAEYGLAVIQPKWLYENRKLFGYKKISEIQRLDVDLYIKKDIGSSDNNVIDNRKLYNSNNGIVLEQNVENKKLTDQILIKKLNDMNLIKKSNDKILIKESTEQNTREISTDFELADKNRNKKLINYNKDKQFIDQCENTQSYYKDHYDVLSSEKICKFKIVMYEMSGVFINNIDILNKRKQLLEGVSIDGVYVPLLSDNYRIRINIAFIQKSINISMEHQNAKKAWSSNEFTIDKIFLSNGEEIRVNKKFRRIIPKNDIYPLAVDRLYKSYKYTFRIKGNPTAFRPEHQEIKTNIYKNKLYLLVPEEITNFVINIEVDNGIYESRLFKIS